ncbi:MAG: TlpA disulfide reductase family protein [Pirellulaceae bacterium]|nr:TlpA disulfide reductase family protein [Pirellulaceae bacterium]
MSTRKEHVELKSSTKMHIRRRFAAWSLAVVGALSSSGVVSLQPAAAWGFDDTAATEKKGDEEKDDAVFNREVFSKLLAANKFEEAATRLDAAIADAPDNSQLLSMEYQLAMMLNRTNAEESKKRVAALAEKLMAKEELDASASMLLSQTVMMRVQTDRAMPYEKSLELIDATLAKLEKAAADDSPATKSLMQFKVRTMISADKYAEAKVLLDAMFAEAQKSLDPEKPGSVLAYSSLATLYSSSLGEKYPDEAKAVVDQVEGFLKSRLTDEKAKAQDYFSYLNMKMSMVSPLVYSDPKQADAILADIEKVIETAKERFEEKDLASISSIERGLKSTKSRIESALVREKLIGTQAPEIIADHFVATKPVTMEELRGKVVLLDFWAIWCGPCIATFPHLIEWHEKYADKGLVILGATNFYNYTWDESAGKPVSAEKGTEVTPEEELAMLEKFRESHKLHHGFFVNSKESGYSKAFAVSGIPQAVLLDKAGKIQLIRVGSGEANAKAIEAKIEELLAQ